MGDFSAEQGQVSDVEKKAGTKEAESGKKTNEQLEAELKTQHEVFFGKVDGTQNTFSKAEQLKDPDAKAAMAKDKTEIKGLLVKAATSGETLLQSKENNFSTIRQSADRISKVSGDVEANLQFFTDMDKATASFQKEVQPQLDIINKIQAKGADAKNPQDEAQYKQALSSALESLGQDGVLGYLTKYQGSLANADLQKVYDKIKKPADDAMDQLSDDRIYFLENFEYETDEKKEKMPKELQEFFEIRNGAKDGMGYTGLQNRMHEGQIHLDYALTLQDGETKTGEIDAAKIAYQEAQEYAPKFSAALADFDTTKLPPDFKAMCFAMKSYADSAVKESAVQLKKIAEGHEAPVDADAVLSDIEKTYNEGDDSVKNSLKKTFELRDKMLQSDPPNLSDKDLRETVDKTLSSLCPLKGKLLGIDRTKLSKEQQTKFDSISHVIDSNIAEVSQVLTLFKQNDLVSGLDKLGKNYFKIVKRNINGVDIVTAEQTDEFKNLPDKDKKAYLDQFNGIQASVSIELTQKLGLEEDKEWNAAFGKFENEDWQGAKKDLLAYCNKFQGNPDKTVQIGSARGILQGIMRIEFEQSKEQIYMLDEATHQHGSIAGVDEQQVHFVSVENGLKKLDEVEKEMASGKYLTIEDVWAKVGKPATYKVEQNGISFTDPSVIEHMLAEPDEAVRKQNILKIAKAAQDAGLSQFARKYFAMYFGKEISEKRTTISRDYVAQRFSEIPGKDEQIEAGIKSAKENAKGRFIQERNRKLGLGNVQLSWEIDKENQALADWEKDFDAKHPNLKGEIENSLIDEMWTRMAKQAVDLDMTQTGYYVFDKPDFSSSASGGFGTEADPSKHMTYVEPPPVDANTQAAWKDAYHRVVGKADEDVGGGFTSEELNNKAAGLAVGIMYTELAVAIGALSGGLASGAVVGSETLAGAMTTANLARTAGAAFFVGNTIGMTGAGYLTDPDKIRNFSLKAMTQDLGTNGLLNLIFEGSGKVLEAVGEAGAAGRTLEKAVGKTAAKEGTAAFITPFGEQVVNTGMKVGKGFLKLSATSTFNAGLMSVVTGSDFADNLITFMAMGAGHEFLPESDHGVSKENKPTKEDLAIGEAAGKSYKADEAARDARAKAEYAKGEGLPGADKLEIEAKKREQEAKDANDVFMKKINAEVEIEKKEIKAEIKSASLLKATLGEIEAREKAEKLLKANSANEDPLKKLVDDKDPAAVDANKKFAKALEKGDWQTRMALKAAHPEWAIGFENMELQAKIETAQMNIDSNKMQDKIQTGIAGKHGQDLLDYFDKLSKDAKDPRDGKVLDQALAQWFSDAPTFPTYEVYSAIENGSIVAGPKLVDALINENATQVVNNKKIQLNAEQQGNIVAKLSVKGGRDFNIDELKEQLEAGRIDASNPAVIDSLMKTPEGREIGEQLINDGKAPITENILKELFSDVNNESGLEQLEAGLKDGTFKLDPELNKEAILQKIEHQKDANKDARTLSDLRQDPDKLAEFQRTLNETAKKLKNGEPVSNDVVEMLQRLKDRDPVGYDLLLNSDTDRMVSNKCLDGMIRGDKVEFEATGVDGKIHKVISYKGKRIGEGGMGEVFHSAFTTEGGTQLEFGAIKNPHADKVGFFVDEINGAHEIQSWNHDHIITPLQIGSDFIIYETGEKAMGLDSYDVIKDGVFSLQLLQQAGDGLLVYQEHGKFHGDIKEQNILAIKVGVDANGKDIYAVKIIDNTPVDYVQTENHGGWPATYRFDSQQMYDTRKGLEARGIKTEEINAFIGRSQDNYAYGKMVKDTLDHSYPGWETDPKNAQLLNDIQACHNPQMAGQKGLTQALQRDIGEFVQKPPEPVVQQKISLAKKKPV